MKTVTRFLMRRFEWIFVGPLAAFYWILLAVLGVATVTCGFLAWFNHDIVGGEEWVVRPESGRDFLLVIDAAHRGLKALFSSDHFLVGDIHQTPVIVLATRFLGAVFFVLLAGRLFLFAVGGRIAKAFARARMGHDIVIGNSLTAYRYMRAINRQTNHLYTGQALMTGTGFERVVNLQRSRDFENDLGRAGLKRARRVVIAEDGDESTWATARGVAAMDAANDKEIISNIEDTWLLERISQVDPDAHIRPFSYASGAARQVMLAHPPYLLARAYGAPAQHIVIVGYDFVGQALLREFLVTSISWSPAEMMVTIIDPNADKAAAQFRALHPGLAPYVRVTFLKGDLTADDKDLEARFVMECDRSPVCAVYIAIEEEGRPLRFAVAIKDRAERMGWFRAPIFVLAPDGAGLPQMRQGVGKLGQPFQRADKSPHIVTDLTLVPFGGWHAALDGAGLLSKEFDDQARVFHNAYRELVGANNKPTSELAPAQKPWPELSEEYRVSNRRVAAHLRAKLDAAGFDLASWLEGGCTQGRAHMTHEVPPAAHVLDLDDIAELDRLASLEHQRWSVDRALNGWRYGRERNDQKRLHPMLVKERQLSEEEREKDRNNIRQTARLIRDITNGDFDKS